MWLKINEEVYAPDRELVGIFRPESFPGNGDVNKKARSAVLLADGRVAASPFGVKVLAERLEAGKI